MILGVVAQRQGGAAPAPSPTLWTPANAATAVFYDPSDFASMWQDSAKTTPVTATGQTVGYINDKSGNGVHASQATVGKRPLLQQDGSGAYYLDFDGTDDGLQSVITLDLSGTTGYSIMMAVQQDGAPGATQVLLEHSENYNSYIGTFIALMGTATSLQVGRRVGSGTYIAHDSATGVDGAVQVVSYASDTILGSTLATEVPYYNLFGTDARITPAGTYADTSTSGDNRTLNLGARNAASLYWDGRLYGLSIMASVADATTRQKFEGYYAHLTGTQASLVGGHPYLSTPPYV